MAATLRIEVVYALPARCWRIRVELPEGATVGDALTLAEIERQVPDLRMDPQRLAVFGTPVALQSPLHDGDRIEILRPLQADPKQARRQRAEDAAKLSRR